MASGKQYRKRSGRRGRQLGIVACALVAVAILIGITGISLSSGHPQVGALLQPQVGHVSQEGEEGQAGDGDANAQRPAWERDDGVQLTADQPDDASTAEIEDADGGAVSGADDSAGVDVHADVSPAEFKERLAALPAAVPLDTAADVATEQAEHKPDTVLMEVDPDISAGDVNGLLSKLDFVATKDVSGQDLSIGLVELALEPGTDVARAAYTLEETGLTGGAQPNYIYHLLDDDLTVGEFQAKKTNDPEFDKQWALEKVQAFDAWQIAQVNKDVTVAILDNGCIADHQDLKDNIVATYNALNFSTDVSHVTSSVHGTHVAGIISAVSDNAKGVSGVSYNAGILPIQVFAKTSNGERADTTTLVKAYEYVLSHASEYNIKVVNMSLGAVLDEDSDEIVEAKIEAAYSRGIVTVCAAGNSGIANPPLDSTPPFKCFPVDYCDKIVGVINLEENPSASDGTGVSVSPASNYNMPGQKTKNIAAPGTNIYSTFGPSTSPYGNLSGTSMAAPLVAGILALEFKANLNLTAASAIDALYEGATDLGTPGWDEATGYGMVNAYGALQAIDACMMGESAVPVNSTIKFAPSKYKASAWSWSSSNESVATVDASGNVTGVSAGTATITAKCSKAQVSKDIVVYTASLTGTSVLMKDQRVQFSLTSSLTGNWNLTSSDSDVATVAVLLGRPIVRGVGAGSATVTATHRASGASVSVNVDVFDAVIVNSANQSSGIGVTLNGTASLSVKGGPANARWTWSTSNSDVCSVSIPGSDSRKAVIEGVSAGRVSVYAALEGYSGFVVSTIATVGTDISDGTVELSANSCTYDPRGTDLPTPKKVLLNGTELDSKCYSYKRYNADGAGTATVTVTGASDKGYFGNITEEFEIEPASIDELATVGSISGLVYTGSAQRPEPDVSVMKREYVLPFVYYDSPTSLVEGTDYTLSYKNNTNAGTATVTVKGKGNYTGTISKQFTIAAAPISKASFSAIASNTYTGEAFTPTPALTFNGVWLKNGTDYTLSYRNNTAAGTATVVAEGKGNYTGTASKQFTIAKASLSNASISVNASYDYSGSAITPVPTVTWRGTTLKEGVDYTLSYRNNTAAGTATVVAEGTGNFSSTKAATFTIARKSMAGAYVSTMATRAYTGKRQTPSPGVYLGATKLVKDIDYVLSYKNNVNAGLATVTVKGKGNYAGTVSATFRIKKAANPMRVTTRTKSVKRLPLKKRSQTVSGAFRFIARAKGIVTYAKTSGSSTKLSVASKTGKITVRKGTAKGTYKIRVKVRASGNANYVSSTRIVTVKVRVI